MFNLNSIFNPNYPNLLACVIVSFLSTFLLIFCIDERYKKTKKLLFALASMFYLLEGISMATVMSTINYQFLVNLLDPTNFAVVFKTKIFMKYIIIGTSAFILIAVTMCLICKKFKIKNKKVRHLIILICLTFLVTPFSSTFRFARTLYNLMYDPNYRMNYKEAFKDITGYDFVDKDDLIVSLSNKPKNLVFIILESVEESFMNEQLFGGIVKDIKNIAYSGEYYSKIQQIEGSSWTMAGIHTLLCGSPRVYNLERDRIFKAIRVSKLVCLSDVLEKAGYYQVYYGGESRDFAGKFPFLKMHGYNEVYGKREIRYEYPELKNNGSNWGVKDIDLFNIAKDKYIKLSKTGRPFNLTFTTLAPHIPNGIYDERCRNSTSDGILNAVECTNDYLKDFIDFLKQQPNYKDTVVVIAPDHIAMIPDPIIEKRGRTINKSGVIGKRTLYAIFLNTGEVKKIDGEILYTDIANMTLEKLNIKHNARFLMYNYKNDTVDNRIDFFEKNIKKVRTFNQKSIMQD